MSVPSESPLMPSPLTSRPNSPTSSSLSSRPNSPTSSSLSSRSSSPTPSSLSSRSSSPTPSFSLSRFRSSTPLSLWSQSKPPTPSTLSCRSSSPEPASLSYQSSSPEPASLSYQSSSPEPALLSCQSSSPESASLSYRSSSPEPASLSSRSFSSESASLSSRSVSSERASLSSRSVSSERASLSSRSVSPAPASLSSRSVSPEPASLSSRSVSPEPASLSSRSVSPEPASLSSRSVSPEPASLPSRSSSATSSSPLPSPSTSSESSLHENNALVCAHAAGALENQQCRDQPNGTRDRKSAIHVLLEKSCPIVKRGARHSTLHRDIADLSWPDTLEQLANLGAKPTNRNCVGDTAVHLGFRNGVTEGQIFESLLRTHLNYARNDVTNNDGLSLLHIACAKASLEQVEKLLERYPAGINQQVDLSVSESFAGFTPLHFAVQYNRVEIVALLLKNNAEIYVKARADATPLHLAMYCSTKNDMIDIIDLILKHDKRFENYVDSFGLNHLMVACAGSRSSIVENFLKEESKSNLSLSEIVKCRVKDTMAHAFGGYTPLHFAAENGNFETAYILLCYGANPVALTTRQLAPIALSRWSNYSCVSHLLYCNTQREDRNLGGFVTNK